MKTYRPTGEVRHPKKGELCSMGNGDGVTRCPSDDWGGSPRMIYEEVDDAPCPDSIMESIVALHRSRSVKGLAKYGVTLDRDDLSFDQWAEHLLLELMDAAGYIQRLRKKVAGLAQGAPGWEPPKSIAETHGGPSAAAVLSASPAKPKTVVELADQVADELKQRGFIKPEVVADVQAIVPASRVGWVSPDFFEEAKPGAVTSLSVSAVSRMEGGKPIDIRVLVTRQPLESPPCPSDPPSTSPA